MTQMPAALNHSQVYVDLMEPHKLDRIVAALQSAMDEKKLAVWPAAAVGGTSQRLKYRPVLVPLNRLGTSQGYSGASVFIGYLLDEAGEILPSRPMVIKIGSERNLTYEREAAASWPPDAFGDDASFAIPFFLRASSQEDCHVLLAHFSSRRTLGPKYEWQLGLHDLWNLLNETHIDVRETSDLLTRVYGTLSRIHSRGRVKPAREVRNFHSEYEWYLRGQIDPDSVASRMFGDSSVVQLYGEEWPNPVHFARWVCSNVEAEVGVGPVHGDLHPKNIVLDDQQAFHIIDFGWASSAGHLVRDYALMEVNLRAMTCPSQVPIAELMTMAQFLSPDDPNAPTEERLAGRINLISEGIWASLSRHRVIEDWDTEYLVPMFLIAFGLLRHLDGARNQSALVMTVLALARRLEGKVGRS